MWSTTGCERWDSAAARRNTRRAVATAKAAYPAGHRRSYWPCLLAGAGEVAAVFLGFIL